MTPNEDDTFSDQTRVIEALRAGAVGYLLKDSDPRDLLAAVRNAADGHAPLDPRVARALLPGAESASPSAQAQRSGPASTSTRR